MRKKRTIGPVVEIMLLALIISVLSLILNLVGFTGYVTEAGTFITTLNVVNNIFTTTGIKYLLNNSLTIFQSLEPLAIVIISLIAVSILESSGLLKHVFSYAKRIKPMYVTAIVIFIGIISTFIGDYSYALLLPLAGVLYKYIGRNSSLGVLTMFIAITVGYGTGIIYNYNMYELGNITEASAQAISANYNYELLSNLFILIVSTISLTIVGTIALERMAKKYKRNEYTDNLNTSRKALKITSLVFLLIMIVLIYCVIPGLPYSGILLDRTEPTYIGKLFGPGATLRNGLIFLIIAVFIICGLIYGSISRNIKNSNDYSKALTKSFENTGYIFVLLFFISILYEIIDWTNISTVITTKIVDFIGSTNLSGIVLVIVALFSIILISIIIPASVTKWTLIAPIYVPLLMRANISPSFAQTIFLAADSVGKLLSPIYIYLIITIGFMYKYDNDSNKSILGTMKKAMPAILLVSLVWIVIIIGWYLLGMPMGINTRVTL